MESCDDTHTSIADEHKERAKNVDVTMNHPYSSCYDGMLEQSKLLGHARQHQEEARKIRKIFNDIDKEGKSILSDGEMLRKGVLTVSRRKAPFSSDQLIQVCEHMFEDLSFVAFKGTADARPYVVVIFSPNCQYGDVCEVKTRSEIFKKEVAVDNFLIRFKVESIFSPEKYLQHLQDRLSGFIIRNKNCSISKELAARAKTLKEVKHTVERKNNLVVCLEALNSIKRRGKPFH